MTSHQLLSRRLEETGLADVAKAWIRGTVAQDLLLNHGHGAVQIQRAKPRDEDDRLCDGLVYDHLHRRQLRYTQSVLAAEQPMSANEEKVVDELRESLSEICVRHTLSAVSRSEDDSSLLIMLRLSRAFAGLSSTENGSASQLPAVQCKKCAVGAGEENAHCMDPAARLERRLAEVEEKHALLRSMDASAPHAPVPAPVPVSNKDRNRQEGTYALSDIAEARAAEAARVRVEERARFEALLASFHAESSSSYSATIAGLQAGVAREEDRLAKARHEAEAGAAALRDRLVADMDAASMREAQARRASALESRSAALETARHEDEERRLLGRVAEAEAAGRHAEAKARLDMERWKAEWILGMAIRETALARGESALSAARATLETAERAHFAAISTLPRLDAEVAAWKQEAARLKDEIAAVQREADGATAELARLHRTSAEDASRISELEGRLTASMEAGEAAKAATAAAMDSARTSREEWTAAVRMLRDRLAAAAAAKDVIVRAHSECEAHAKAVQERERERREEREKAWTTERSLLVREAERAVAESRRETDRADEAASALSAERARTTELVRTVAELRAMVSARSQALGLSMGMGSGPPSLNNSAIGSTGLGQGLSSSMTATGPVNLSGSGLSSSFLQPGSSFAASQVALARAAEALGVAGTLLLPTAVQTIGQAPYNDNGLAETDPPGSGWVSAHSTPGRPPLPPPV